MIIWLLLFLQAVTGCEGMKNDTFFYIGGPQPTILSAQKYLLKKFRGRSVAGIPIPGGSGPRYQVKVAGKPQPAAVGESRPVFQLASKTPIERVVAVRLNACGKDQCFNLYEDGPAFMAVIRLEWREFGPGCYEFHPERSLIPGEYALVILAADLMPQQVARFVVGPAMPPMEMPK